MPFMREIRDQLSVVVGDVPNGRSYSRQSVVSPVFSVHRLQQIADTDGINGPSICENESCR